MVAYVLSKFAGVVSVGRAVCSTVIVEELPLIYAIPPTPEDASLIFELVRDKLMSFKAFMLNNPPWSFDVQLVKTVDVAEKEIDPYVANK